MIDFLIENEFPFVLILTKKDKLTKTQLAERLEALQTEIPCADQITMIPFSSEKGDGVEEVNAIIDEIAAGICRGFDGRITTSRELCNIDCTVPLNFLCKQIFLEFLVVSLFTFAH